MTFARDSAQLMNQQKFSLVHLNAQCLRAKSDEVVLFLLSLNHEFDLIYFSETWFSSSDCFLLPGYDCVSVCRCLKLGGVAALYVRSELPHQIPPNYKTVNENVECVVIHC